MDIFSPASTERPPGSEMGFAQGTVVAWSAVAGTNQISVRGSVLTNLPSLIGSEVGLIRPGDVVALIRFQTTFFVLGRIEVADTAQRAFGVATDRELTEEDVSVSSGAPFFDLPGGPQVSVYIGSSRRCQVILSAMVRSYFGVSDVGVRVSGASSIAPNFWQVLSVSASGPGISVSAQLSGSRTIQLSADDGLNEGLNVFTMVYRFNKDDPTGAGTFSDREITVQPY
jgi:hypothetical protein